MTQHTPEQQRQAHATLTARVRKHGYTLVGSAAVDMGGLVTFTCGLTSSYGHPEIVLTGLPAKQSEPVLANIAGAVRDGRLTDPGPTHSQTDFPAGHFADVALRLRRVNTTWAGHPTLEAAVQIAAEFGAPQSPHFLQVLYPDTSGRFPDEHGCTVAKLQPDLSRRCRRTSA